jgi:putative spermidine/putrescine transport system ATP-binding protein
MSDAILELRDVRRTYGNVNAVDGVSIKLAAGEFLSFLGPSGSGKTTTLSMIAGLAEPSSGEILLRGRRLNPLPSFRRNIGVVFQNYALFPHMSAEKNIAFPLEMRGVPRAEIERRVAKVLSLVGLASHGSRLPSQLSGGQQQRVALARAIVFEPPLLLMDEPLGALDKKLREQMQLEIKQLHRDLMISIIYVTHDQEEALTMSNRIAVFNNGKIEQVGTPSDLYEHPKTRFVANFIGETNLFSGAVSELSDGWCQIDCSGLSLRARSSGGIAKGQKVSVAVRPERTLLRGPGEAPAAAENRITGTISETVYLGRSRKYVVSAAGTQVTVVQQIGSGRERLFSIGDAVEVHWQIQDATAVLETIS